MAARVEPYVKVDIVIKDEPTRLAIDGSTNVGCVIVAPVGPKVAFIQGPNEFLSTYTVDGSIPRDADITLVNAYYMSFFAGLVVSRSMNSDATGGLAFYKQGKEISAVPAYFKDNVELTERSSFSFLPEIKTEGGSTSTPENYAIIVDNIIYYVGNLEEVIKGFEEENPADEEGRVDFASMEAVSISQLDQYSPMPISNLAAELNREGNYVASYADGVVYLYHDEYTKPSLNKATKLTVDGGVEVEVTPVNMAAMSLSEEPAESGVGTKVALLSCKNAQMAGNKGNIYEISASNSRLYKGHEVFDLTLNDGKGDKTYLVSFDQEAIDSSDANCYIELLNSMNDMPFEISVIQPFTDAINKLPLTRFGEAFVDAAQSKEISCMMPALYALEDQESFSISYLAPCGVTNLQFVKALNDVGFRNRWFVPVDIPYDRTNSNSIINYGVQVPDSYGMMLLGPFDKNTGLLGWLNYIAASTLYYERVFTNRASNSEFAPVFDAQTGLMAYSNPVKLIDKKQREKLLSQAQPINYVLYDEAEQAHYMNDNWNHYSLADNVMGEENATRMVFKIARDLQRLYKQFKAKHNSMKTRKNVVDITNLYFKQNIMNQNFCPEEFLVICDRTNNTDDIINSRKLAVTVKVRLYKSIKYITVLEEVYSVGGASFEE